MASTTTTTNGVTTITESIQGTTVDAITNENLHLTVGNLTVTAQQFATAADVALISASLASIQAQVDELNCIADRSINYNLTINSTATLELWESIINTSIECPNRVLNGTLTVNTCNLSDDEIARTNAILNKISAVVNDVHITTCESQTVSLDNLSFIDGDYTINGNPVDDNALRTISGTLNINYFSVGPDGLHTESFEPINYSHLSSVNRVEISSVTAARTTGIDFNEVSVGSMTLEGNDGILTFANATSVKLGTTPFDALTIPQATCISTDGFPLNTTSAIYTSPGTWDYNVGDSGWSTNSLQATLTPPSGTVNSSTGIFDNLDPSFVTNLTLTRQ